MQFLTHPAVLAHNTGTHPENRRRIEVFAPFVEPLDQIYDGEAFLELIHPKDYIDTVRRHSLQSLPFDGDTMAGPGSFEAATAAVALTVMAMESNNFALVRPPGHHAFRTEAHGFCLFNNIAIATQKAVQEGKRVFILDIDGHLGDGTLDIFYDTDRVLFWSLHQYPAYPGNGAPQEIGRDAGQGYSINVAMPAGSADDIYWHALDYIWGVLEQFNPDLVAVSAGFDAHQFDPLLQLHVSSTFYYKIGRRLADAFPGRLFAVLEGGYNLDELPKCACNFLAGVNNEPIPFPERPTASGQHVWETYEMYLHKTVRLLSNYWKF